MKGECREDLSPLGPVDTFERVNPRATLGHRVAETVTI